jgi:hypothetical protein
VFSECLNMQVKNTVQQPKTSSALIMGCRFGRVCWVSICWTVEFSIKTKQNILGSNSQSASREILPSVPGPSTPHIRNRIRGSLKTCLSSLSGQKSIRDSRIPKKFRDKKTQTDENVLESVQRTGNPGTSRFSGGKFSLVL